jgi:Domain of unknown function (DUF4262)
MNDPQHATRDDLEKIVVSNINEFGWHAINVIEDDGHPPWSYSIGLFETWEFPELLIIGRSRATSYAMLNSIAKIIELNDPPDLTDPNGYLLLGMKCRFVEVLPRYYADYVGFALSYYRKRHFPLFQIVWPNTDGLYPWHPHAPKSLREWQPALGNSPCATDGATD